MQFIQLSFIKFPILFSVYMYKIHICIFFSKFQILPSSFCPLILLDIYVILGRKVMTPLDSIFKSRDITLPTKVCLVKAMVFPVVMYECESWTVKKAEHRRIDAFELWCWRGLLWVPWTARRSNHPFWRRSALGVLWKEWCYSWNSSTLAPSCEELTHWKRLWCWEGLGAGGEGVGDGRVAWCPAIHGVAKSWTWLSDWTELNWTDLRRKS